MFELRPELAPYKFAPMRGLVLKSRDGRELVSYLTLPRDVEGDRPPEPLPMVLSVHGGPWSRDQYGFNSFHQWMANRGCAVLSVNYRGSTGFGKDFINAGDRQHARAMHEDLLDAVDWAVREGIARRDRVAIRGASYGGHAALVGLTFTPDTFRCGVSIVGISNLITMLESMPPYWSSIATTFYRRYHDPRTAEGRDWLWSRSPLSRVDQIKQSLLIGLGQNDVRCKLAESEQIVAAMRERGLPVRFLVYPDEGHGFIRPENRLSFLAIEEAFYAEHLGTRRRRSGGIQSHRAVTMVWLRSAVENHHRGLVRPMLPKNRTAGFHPALPIRGTVGLEIHWTNENLGLTAGGVAFGTVCRGRGRVSGTSCRLPSGDLSWTSRTRRRRLLTPLLSTCLIRNSSIWCLVGTTAHSADEQVGTDGRTVPQRYHTGFISVYCLERGAYGSMLRQRRCTGRSVQIAPNRRPRVFR